MSPGHGDTFARRWWDLLDEHRLYLQRCERCGVVQHPPGPICRTCRGREYLGWMEHDQRAALVSVTRVHHSTYAEFADRVPYWLGLVHLGGGAHALALLPDTATSAITSLGPGTAGTLGFGTVTGTTVLTFRPDSTSQHNTRGNAHG